MSAVQDSKREKASHQRMIAALGEVFRAPLTRLDGISEEAWNEANGE